jgi:transposase
MERIVGLDAHSKRCVYAIEDEAGTIVAQGDVPTSLEGLMLLRERHGLPRGTPVGLESGTMAFFVARRLKHLGLVPVVVDAREVRAKTSRPNQKSDRRDALELCKGLRRGIYRSIVHVPPDDVVTLRETLSRRRHFVGIRTTQVNAVKRLLRAAGLGTLPRRLAKESGWDRLLKDLALDPALQGFCEQHRALWRCADAQIAALEGSLNEQRKHWATTVDCLQTVPGVGPVVALTVIAAFSDPARFPSAKHAASYAGLVASSHQSGERDSHGHITKCGSAELRSMLCEAAHHACRAGSPLNPYFRQLCVRRGYKMAIVSVAHRLCRIMWAMLRDGTSFDVERLRLEPREPWKKTTRPNRLRQPEAVPA